MSINLTIINANINGLPNGYDLKIVGDEVTLTVNGEVIGCCRTKGKNVAGILAVRMIGSTCSQGWSQFYFFKKAGGATRYAKGEATRLSRIGLGAEIIVIDNIA